MKSAELRDPPELAAMIEKAIRLHEEMSAEEQEAAWEAQRRSIMASVRREIAEGGTC